MNASRNPWPIGIGVFIGFFFLAMVAFVVWSLDHRQDLVAPDYHARDLAYQSIIDSDQRTRALGTTPLRLRADQLEIQVPTASSNVQLTFYRPSSARMDSTTSVEPDHGGHATHSIAGLAAGRWRALLTWDMAGEAYRTELDLIADPARP